MTNELLKFFLWPDGVFCQEEELEEYLTYKSDDFAEIFAESEEEIEDMINT